MLVSHVFASALMLLSLPPTTWTFVTPSLYLIGSWCNELLHQWFFLQWSILHFQLPHWQNVVDIQPSMLVVLGPWHFLLSNNFRKLVHYSHLSHLVVRFNLNLSWVLFLYWRVIVTSVILIQTRIMIVSRSCKGILIIHHVFIIRFSVCDHNARICRGKSGVL